jgi:hypothetical protein
MQFKSLYNLPVNLLLLFCNVYHMLSPDQLRQVATGRDRRLPGKALGPYTIGAQQSLGIDRIKDRVELMGTRMFEGYRLWPIDRSQPITGICLVEQRETTEHRSE